MSAKVHWARQHYARLMRQTRARIALRRVTRTTGPNPKTNPAAIDGLQVDGNHAIGMTTLALRGSRLVGRFLPGDIVQIGSQACYVAAAADDNGANRVSLTLQVPTTIMLAGGTPVNAVFWGADQEVAASVEAYPENLIDGQMIVSGDLRIMLAALDCKVPPETGHIVMVGLGDEARRPYVVQASRPILEELHPVAYQIQVRAS